MFSSASVGYSLNGSPVHAASLVDPLKHSSELLQLLDITLSPPVIEYLVDCISEVVDDALARAGVSVSEDPSSYRSKFTAFVTKVISRSEVSLPVVLVALAYLDRASSHLCIPRAQWAHERVFLGVIICAAKYTNDTSLKNVHWAICTGFFGRRDIGRIERELLDVLEWRLRVSEEDVLAHRKGLMRAAGVRLRVRNASRSEMEGGDEEHFAAPFPRSHRRRPHHHRRNSSSFSAASLPGLSPPTRDSLSPSPSLSPRTPPPHLPDVPMDVDVDADIYDAPIVAPAKNGRFVSLMRSLPRSLPVSRPAPVPVRGLPPRPEYLTRPRRLVA